MDVPEGLLELSQWILWRNELRGKDKKPTKVPYQVNGSPAKTNDPTTWDRYENVAYYIDQYDGVGFVFSESDPFYGFDLDGCRNPDTGEIAKWAWDIINKLNTYAEVSPSQTGVKLFGIGKLSTLTGKKKNLDETPVSHKTPGVECYDRKRYFTFTGDWMPGTPREPKNSQTALDEIVEHYWAKQEQQKKSVIVAQTNYGHEVEERAAKYIATIPGAISGQGGHNTTFRVACLLVIGFGLPRETAFRLLSQWNHTCDPMWSEKELWHKIDQANAQEQPRGQLLNSSLVQSLGVDLTGILPADVAEPVVDTSPGPMPDVDPPGFLRQIVEFNLDSAMYPQPELALGAGIALLGTITGRKVCAGSMRTNVYAIGIAPSGAGKEHARQLNKSLLFRAGVEKMIGPERVASSAGLVTSVVESPAILFQLDEFSRLLQTMRNPSKSPHLYNVGTVLMQLESSANTIWVSDAYADAKKTKRINQPHACVYGTSVPEDFWTSLSVEDLKNGLMGRLMLFESSFPYPGYQKPTTKSVPPESLVEAVKWWLQFAPGGNLNQEHPSPIEVPESIEAQERLQSHFAGIAARRLDEHAGTAALWSRSGGRAQKLALIFACSRCIGSPTIRIELEDVERAIKLSNWMTRRILYQANEYLAENQIEDATKRVLRLIPLKGSITQTDLTRRTQWLRKRERDDILSQLIESKMITICQEQNGNKQQKTLKRINSNFKAI